jgi:ADP-ribose pyrophosphatase YjhB (NUDIX family)
MTTRQRKRSRRRYTRTRLPLPASSTDRLADLPADEAAEPTITEYSAGGVVFKQTPRGYEIAFIKDPYGKWAFAKGHVETGETLEQAAVRETREEMGLRSLRLVAPLGRIKLLFEDRYRQETKGRMIRKYVHYFLMQAAPGAFGKPQKTEKIRAMTWVPLEQAIDKSGYEDVRPLIMKATKLLRQQERRAAARRRRQASEAVSREAGGSAKRPQHRSRRNRHGR